MLRVDAKESALEVFLSNVNLSHLKESPDPEAQNLFSRLIAAVADQDHQTIKDIFKQSLQFKKAPTSPSESWDHFMSAQPAMGPEGNDRIMLAKLLTEKAKPGYALEAMCGYQTYINNDPKFNNITALDFSPAALERYGYPDREKVVFDLNNITNEQGQLPFEDSRFKTVCITLGVNYLINPRAVYREFSRVITPDGNLLVAGDSSCIGYRQFEVDRFNPGKVLSDMESVGFRTQQTYLPYVVAGELHNFYLLDGQKS